MFQSKISKKNGVFPIRRCQDREDSKDSPRLPKAPGCEQDIPPFRCLNFTQKKYLKMVDVTNKNRGLWGLPRITIIFPEQIMMAGDSTNYN